jgi:hypothetical protein
LEPTHHNQINTISCFTKSGANNDHDHDHHDHVDDDYFKKTSKKLYLNKKEKLKQFTISVFVDSFEDYSFNKTNSDTSSTTINNNNSINVQSPKENNHYQCMEQPLVDYGNSSLKEFELNEARTSTISTTNTCNTSRNQSIINIEHENLNDIANKKKPTFQATRIYDDDVFMFESRPNNFGLWMNNNACVLASKSPLMPVHIDTNKNLSTNWNTNSNNASINKYKSDSNSGQEEEEEEGKDKAALKSLNEILHNLDDRPSNENERDSFFKADTNELIKNFG